MSENSLIKIEGKPVEKLIDVISKGIGTVYRPRAIRKEAEAEAYKIEIIERAKSKALAEGKEIDAEVSARINQRLLHQETRRQLNIDNVAEIAAKQLERETTISEEQVNDDWTTRFFNIVKDISEIEMQTLWGRILAGEVKHPKSFSLRTLELLKNLNKDEAEIFMKIGTHAIKTINNYKFIFRGNYKNVEKFFTYSDISRLIECGLIQPGDTISLQYNTNKEGYSCSYWTENYVTFINIKPNSPFINIPIYPFTNSGCELLNLIKADTPFEYISLFAKAYMSNLFGNKKDNVDVKFTEIVSWENEIFIYDEENLKDFSF